MTSWESVLLEKPIVGQQVGIFPVLCVPNIRYVHISFEPGRVPSHFNPTDTTKSSSLRSTSMYSRIPYVCQ
jgi:hypothetical protein